ncbi:MAG: hypothetical protein ACI9CB_002971 [Rhodothermales bacterium]|jgi:hypothetical protein
MNAAHGAWLGLVAGASRRNLVLLLIELAQGPPGGSAPDPAGPFAARIPHG